MNPSYHTNASKSTGSGRGSKARCELGDQAQRLLWRGKGKLGFNLHLPWFPCSTGTLSILPFWVCHQPSSVPWLVPLVCLSPWFANGAFQRLPFLHRMAFGYERLSHTWIRMRGSSWHGSGTTRDQNLGMDLSQVSLSIFQGKTKRVGFATLQWFSNGVKSVAQLQ